MDELVKKSDIAKREEETLAKWEREHIFEKSLAQTKKGKPFVFYDGPPFATGLPHYGHIVASTIKDAIPRYQTMRGRFVRRVWGWDCHGLPIENLIEKELGLEHKKDIEEYGIENFNEAARKAVTRYENEWGKMIPRIGRWVDMEHSYKTMDANYTESIWWSFKDLFGKGLIYQNFKSMHICTRCETTLSNNEVAEGYKEISDISVIAKFELIDEPGTFALAWTTTPWTLPGNVVLAVNPDEKYSVVRVEDEKYILATPFLEKVLAGKKYEIIKTIKGKELVGKSYKPLFDYYSKDKTLENHDNGWKIYGADFVTMESGTGIVHVAPAFGEDDMALGKKENLPFIQHVRIDGLMKPEVKDFAGMPVKPKSDDEKTRLATDIAVLKYLQEHGTFFSKEKVKHAYPHCWRCDTPLLNYAAESWFVKAPALKEKLHSENAKTRWIPETLRDGRFGKWIESTRDWAISRSRYWGAPLPVWNCDKRGEQFVSGSRAELAEKTKKSGNKYFVMRHGEALSNTRGIVSSKIKGSEAFGLTPNGRAEAKKTGNKLKSKKIDIIITSPFARTKETADIVAEAIGYDAKKIITDERLKEIDGGILNERPIEEYRKYFSSTIEKFEKHPEGGENLLDVKRRCMELLSEIEGRFTNKTILIVTHEYSVWMLASGSQGLNPEETVILNGDCDDFVKTGEMVEVKFTPFPHNDNFEFDLHRPYIDRVPVVCSCGATMTRVPYVFDCWFESGSMPHAQFHYPFENQKLFKQNFPANFIAEGIDQTRGWFYSLLVLSVGLFKKTPFQNVIVNGLILAEDGQKMSKKLKNYPEPGLVINRYGADALRYYLLASPVVHAEDVSFAEKGVDEVVKKVIMRLMNVLSFYELHSGNCAKPKGKSKNPLDQWILAELAMLGQVMTKSFDAYELDRAVKPLGTFVDDLSTWYLRRSRDRFKSDDMEDRAQAVATTREVFLEFSKLLAPIMPFLAEHLYKRMNGEKESVHLESWPKAQKADMELILDMEEVREVISAVLERRAKLGIKVRQPLGKLTVFTPRLKNNPELFYLIKEEVNVEMVEAGNKTKEGAETFQLSEEITPDLMRKGQFRELLRTVQDLRKQSGLVPSDIVTLEVATDDAGRSLINDFTDELKKTARLKEILFKKEIAGEPVDIGGISVTLLIASSN